MATAEQVDEVGIPFDPNDAIQAQAEILRLAGGRLSAAALDGALYLAFRRRVALSAWPLDYGPVAWSVDGPTFRRIRELSRHGNLWRRYVRVTGEVAMLLREPGDGSLSRAISEDLAAGFELVSHEADLGAAWTRLAPEWSPPTSGLIDVRPSEVVAAAVPRENLSAALDSFHYHACLKTDMSELFDEGDRILESPNFTPAELDAFRARGFERTYRDE